MGGIKTKLAAHRAGLRTVILPRRNEPDLDELPPSVRQELTIHPVDRVAEAFDLALLPDQIKAAGPNQPQCATG